MPFAPVARVLALSVAALALAGCGAPAATPTATTETQTTVTVSDNVGEHTIAVPPASVVATDNRLFETLSDWGVQLAAAPRDLIPTTIAYRDDESVVNLGSHNEPNLEAVVAVEPDLIINGQRFAQYGEDFARLVPDATVLTLDPRDGEPLDEELKRGVGVIGQVFDKEAEAQQLSDDLDAAIARAEAAYDPSMTVMAVNVSGGNIGYIAPVAGRTLGPVFDILGLTPALEIEGATDDHQGDDISVEAIAASNPGLILVLDRDAAVAADDASYQPASQVLEGSEALANVTAITEGNVVYLPNDTYTNEGIQTYTEFFNTLADQLESQP
ncbi:siderophore ABC transporter substrate-binding protein [Propioniciclava soli]|uniref:ABC transporter substrate-binding protein n=1 Tax=Propioniciclava soli TaxID=2775081 RepID=A0ABZ3C607_9ACTN|nr:ABC transporter substrate-binding protein [Propioniciclava soli]